MNKKNTIISIVALAAMSLFAIVAFQSIVAVDERATQRLGQAQAQEQQAQEELAEQEETTLAINQCSNGMWSC